MLIKIPKVEIKERKSFIPENANIKENMLFFSDVFEWMSCWPAEKLLKPGKKFEACFDRHVAQLTVNQAIFDSPRI